MSGYEQDEVANKHQRPNTSCLDPQSLKTTSTSTAKTPDQVVESSLAHSMITQEVCIGREGCDSTVTRIGASCQIKPTNFVGDLSLDGMCSFNSFNSSILTNNAMGKVKDCSVDSTVTRIGASRQIKPTSSGGDLTLDRMCSFNSSFLTNNAVGSVKNGSVGVNTFNMGNDGGYLWVLREKIDEMVDLNGENTFIKFGECGEPTSYDLDISLNLSTGSLNAENDYSCPLTAQKQDEITKSMTGLIISPRVGETEKEKGMETPLDPSIWRYLKLLTEKIDEDRIPGLFRKEHMTPASDMLVRMLTGHHMRSTFDFEKCIERGLKLEGASSDPSKWNFRLLDEIAGSGTTTTAIFELKSEGAFKGVKRKNKHTNERRNAPRMDEICVQLNNLDIQNKSPGFGRNKTGPQGRLSVTKSIAGWAGTSKKTYKTSPKTISQKKIDGEGNDEVHKVPNLVSKRSPPSSNELKRRHGVSGATRRTLFSTPPNKRPQARVAANSPGTPRCTQSTILRFLSGKSNKGGKVGGKNQESEARLAQE